MIFIRTFFHSLKCFSKLEELIFQGDVKKRSAWLLAVGWKLKAFKFKVELDCVKGVRESGYVCAVCVWSFVMRYCWHCSFIETDCEKDFCYASRILLWEPENGTEWNETEWNKNTNLYFNNNNKMIFVWSTDRTDWTTSEKVKQCIKHYELWALSSTYNWYLSFYFNPNQCIFV